jgi:ABC-2 type transport system ATP-binding protein
VIVNGKLAAAGDFRAIRDKIDAHDHSIRIRVSDPRLFASELIRMPSVTSVSIDKHDRVIAETNDVRAFYRHVPLAAQKQDVRLFEIQASDESLTSVFSYLVER